MSSSVESEKPPRRALPVADLSTVDAALPQGDEALRQAMKGVRAADVGRDLSRRSVPEGSRLLRASDDRSAALILRSANPTVAANVLSTCELGQSVRMLGFLPVNTQVAILDRLDEGLRERVTADLDAADRRDIQKLLALAPSAVGRFATPKIWRCDRAALVRDALEALRAGSEEIEVAQNLYVTNAEQLVGVVPLRVVAVSDPATPIEGIMTTDVLALTEETEVGDAAEIIQTHDFLSLPIVDKAQRLVGAVRVDDLLDAALSQLGTGFLNQGGVAGKIASQVPYFQAPMWRAVRSRITWLVLLFVAETATGTVLRHFEDELAKVVALSFFIPLLIGTGGNAGSQTVSTVIRALALGEVRHPRRPARGDEGALHRPSRSGFCSARSRSAARCSGACTSISPPASGSRSSSSAPGPTPSARSFPLASGGGGDRPDGGLRAAHHDAGRRLGPVHLSERRQAAHRPASRLRINWTVVPEASSAALRCCAWCGYIASGRSCGSARTTASAASSV